MPVHWVEKVGLSEQKKSTVPLEQNCRLESGDRKIYQQMDAASQLYPTKNTTFSIAHQTKAIAHKSHYSREIYCRAR